MNIVLPYTGHLRPEVIRPLADRADLMVVEVPGLDSYHELLRRCWATGMDFLVVEHDVVVTAEALDDLIACDQPWCGQPYMVAGSVQPALGCTRFRGSFTAEWHDVWEAVADHLGTHWSVLDAGLTTLLGAAGRTIHRHDIEVAHLNPAAADLIDPARQAEILRVFGPGTVPDP